MDINERIFKWGKEKKLSENFYIHVNTKMDLDININVVFSHPV